MDNSWNPIFGLLLIVACCLSVVGFMSGVVFGLSWYLDRKRKKT